MTRRKKILMIYTDWAVSKEREKKNAYGGCGYYRVIKPAQYLRRWFDVDVCGDVRRKFGTTASEVWPKVFGEYDLVWTRYIEVPRAASNLLACAEYFNKPVLIDIDDNYRAVTDPQSNAYDVYKKGEEPRYGVDAQLSLCSGVTVTTKPLKKVLSRWNKRIFVLPNCCDVADWPLQKRTYADGKVRVGWAGSVTHMRDLRMIQEVFRWLLEKYPHVELHLIGGIPIQLKPEVYSWIGGHVNRLVLAGGTSGWEGFPNLLVEHGLDIGIAPLAQDAFNTCKSHIKWMEYSMLGIPTIASKVYPYHKRVQWTRTIQHGKTGFIAESVDDWKRYLSLMVESRTERLKIAKQSYEFIKGHWQYSSHIHKWRQVIEKFI